MPKYSKASRTALPYHRAILLNYGAPSLANVSRVAELREAIWMKRSEVGSPMLGDVVATGFHLFLADLSAGLL